MRRVLNTSVNIAVRPYQLGFRRKHTLTNWRAYRLTERSLEFNEKLYIVRLKYDITTPQREHRRIVGNLWQTVQKHLQDNDNWVKGRYLKSQFPRGRLLYADDCQAYEMMDVRLIEGDDDEYHFERDFWSRNLNWVGVSDEGMHFQQRVIVTAPAASDGVRPGLCRGTLYLVVFAHTARGRWHS